MNINNTTLTNVYSTWFYTKLLVSIVIKYMSKTIE